MSANVESMYYVSNEENSRFVPWHGLGTPVEEAPNSEKALEIAGLNWKVVQKDMFVDGNKVPNYKANVRDIDEKILGVVSDRYTIVQNTDAFAFTDNLITGDVRYETAGSLNGGKTIWLLAKLPEAKILGDEVNPYICFTNTHDGTGAVKVCMTPVRVCCNNTLNIALKNSQRAWSCKHMGNVADKLEEAKKALEMANNYMEELDKFADIAANSSITGNQVTDYVKELLPIEEDASDRQKENVNKMREQVISCIYAPDLIKFMNTKWSVIQGVADWCQHTTPLRNTNTYAEKNWGRVMNGHPMLDKITQIVGVSC